MKRTRFVYKIDFNTKAKIGKDGYATMKEIDRIRKEIGVAIKNVFKDRFTRIKVSFDLWDSDIK